MKMFCFAWCLPLGCCNVAIGSNNFICLERVLMMLECILRACSFLCFFLLAYSLDLGRIKTCLGIKPLHPRSFPVRKNVRWTTGTGEEEEVERGRTDIKPQVYPTRKRRCMYWKSLNQGNLTSFIWIGGKFSHSPYELFSFNFIPIHMLQH